jgi:hypothetical protein
LLNLSDLTKEIEHNGEKFVPIEFLSQYPSLKLEDECKSIMSDNRWLNHCSYFLVSYLFEWHFDVFGLIEDGLAIDLNTINK